jgi:hypothetical protein
MPPSGGGDGCPQPPWSAATATATGRCVATPRSRRPRDARTRRQSAGRDRRARGRRAIPARPGRPGSAAWSGCWSWGTSRPAAWWQSLHQPCMTTTGHTRTRRGGCTQERPVATLAGGVRLEGAMRHPVAQCYRLGGQRSRSFVRACRDLSSRPPPRPSRAGSAPVPSSRLRNKNLVLGRLLLMEKGGRRRPDAAHAGSARTSCRRGSLRQTLLSWSATEHLT